MKLKKESAEPENFTRLKRHNVKLNGATEKKPQS